MTRFDYIKSLDAEKVGRYICDVMEILSDPNDPVCEVCPWREKCKSGNNGVTRWLMEEVELLNDGDVISRVKEKETEIIGICDAINTTIEELTAEPCDAVSRKSVIEVISNPLNIRLEAIINKLPSITPKLIDSVLDKIKAEIVKKLESGQWSDAVKYGMLKAILIIDKYKTDMRGGE